MSTEKAQAVIIGENQYNLDDLDKRSLDILSDLEKIQGELNQVQLQNSIYTFAFNKLHDELTERLKDVPGTPVNTQEE